MATAREKYDAARRNQATMLQVEEALTEESLGILNLARDLTNQQDMGGYLRQVVPGLIDRWGMVNAAAAMRYYDEQRTAYLAARSASLNRQVRNNQRRRAERFARARLQAAVYTARMPEFNAIRKAEPVIGYGMQIFNQFGFDRMRQDITNAMTRAVASYNRDTMLYNSALDSAVVKVQRVAEPNACGFCRTLAFKSWRAETGKDGVRTADYAIDFHSNCRCSIETLYEGDEAIRPEYYDQFEREYQQASSDREPGQTVIERMNQLARP